MTTPALPIRSVRSAVTALALATVCALGTWSVAPSFADAASLRSDPAVTGDRIRLGDLFTEIGDKADSLVAQAPAPGQKAVFDAAYLGRIALAFRIDWKPTGGHDRVIVSRASRVIGTDEISDALSRALSVKLPSGRIQVDLDIPSLELHVPVDRKEPLQVESLSVIPTGSRFTAVLVTPSGSSTPQRLTVAGRATSMVEVPVLIRRVASNELITASDIAWVETRADQAVDLVLSEAQLVGQIPRRPLSANMPVRLRDIQSPRAVSKNALVTMVLKSPSLTITAQGRAMQDGAMGDVIRVTNTQSNRVIEATVSGANTVSVQLASAALH